MVLWHVLFFLIPLSFLVYLSFWLVRNYRMVPGFDVVNWVSMYGKDYFWDAYGLTLGLAAASTLLTSLVAFPCAYALAFKFSDTARRWAIFFLIIPFFTSYLVRVYAWQVIIAEHGVINAALAHLGVDPFIMLNTKVGTLIGYLTLCLPLVVILQTFSLAAVDRTLIEAAHNLRLRRNPHRPHRRRAARQGRAHHRSGVLLHPVLRRFRQPLLPRWKPPADAQHPHHRHHQIGSAVAQGRRRGGDHDCHPAGGRLCRGQRGLQETGVTGDRTITLFLRLYVCVVFCFVFAPIAASFVFSFNSDRFPTIPLGSFTLHWYETVYNDPDVWDALRVSVTSAFTVSVVSTFIGFCTAYTDYRYRFFGKSAYLALALLPPTIPLVIMGLAMLAWLSHVGLSGRPISIIIAHVVLCTPFAMAIVRLRLAQMDTNLEAAAWNLGAGEWRAMREVILPFTWPAIVSALCLTAAVSFDEFAVAWFLSGLNKTVPVIILEILQGQIDPRINAIGTFVFITSMTLVIIAQVLLMTRRGARKPTETGK